MGDKYLVTGAAGFIGSAIVHKLLSRKEEVVGIDNYNDFYSPDLKIKRTMELMKNPNFKLINCNIDDGPMVTEIFNQFKPNRVFHLAAQAGIRMPFNSFQKYMSANVVGFFNILKSSIENNVSSFFYASSSSVYGEDSSKSFNEKNTISSPKSFYGLTKLMNEQMAENISKNSKIRIRGGRFFTVYGPWGRPDMSYFRLFNAALNNREFYLFGDGNYQRDFTYIDDIVESSILLESQLQDLPEGFSDVVNIGGGNPISIRTLIEKIQYITDSNIKIIKLPQNRQDLQFTQSDSTYRNSLIQHKEFVSIDKGLEEFNKWVQNQIGSEALANYVASTD